MKWFLAIALLFAMQANAQELPPKADSDKPIEIQADSLEVLQKDKVALFQGKVEAKQGNVSLKADSMRVYYKEKKAGEQNSVSKIDVIGNVFLATPKETIQGAKGIYDVENALITLTDNVIITRDKNVLKGSDLTYNLKTGRSEMKGSAAVGDKTGSGRVRGVFVPEKSQKP
jgi:lipopolysaccharide export system protein LptA